MVDFISKLSFGAASKAHAEALLNHAETLDNPHRSYHQIGRLIKLAERCAATASSDKQSLRWVRTLRRHEGVQRLIETQLRCAGAEAITEERLQQMRDTPPGERAEREEQLLAALGWILLALGGEHWAAKEMLPKVRRSLVYLDLPRPGDYTSRDAMLKAGALIAARWAGQ